MERPTSRCASSPITCARRRSSSPTASIPSNEWRGYVLRKIMRRAMRHGKRLGFAEPFLHELVDVARRRDGRGLSGARRNRDAVVSVVEGRGGALRRGADRRAAPARGAARSGGASADARVPGDEVFRLYDSLGVPLDFIEDLASERQLAVDREGYERAMEGQRERARAGSTFDRRRPRGFTFASDAARHDARATPAIASSATTRPRRRRHAWSRSSTRRGSRSTRSPPARRASPSLDRTPFYLEAGGQVSDTGTMSAGCRRSASRRRRARRPGLAARASRRASTRATCDASDRVRRPWTPRAATRRAAITRRRTCCTRRCAQVLGPHVKQAGSLVAPDRLRFDFVHCRPRSRPRQIARIERIVNEQVLKNTPVHDRGQADRRGDGRRRDGAVRREVRRHACASSSACPGFSLELCGGTHVRATGDIGLFAITSGDRRRGRRPPRSRR